MKLPVLQNQFLWRTCVLYKIFTCKQTRSYFHFTRGMLSSQLRSSVLFLSNPWLKSPQFVEDRRRPWSLPKYFVVSVFFFFIVTFPKDVFHQIFQKLRLLRLHKVGGNSSYLIFSDQIISLYIEPHVYCLEGNLFVNLGSDIFQLDWRSAREQNTHHQGKNWRCLQLRFKNIKAIVS